MCYWGASEVTKVTTESVSNIRGLEAVCQAISFAGRGAWWSSTALPGLLSQR